MKVYLASPRGFCAGVVRAIETVKLTLRQHGRPIYVLHEIVHNKHVISELEALGAHFVVELDEIPKNEICIFSAHGVSVALEKQARQLELRTVNATCPLVSSIHRMVEKYHRDQYDVIIIGHHGHPEVVGTAGRVEHSVHVVATPQEADLLSLTNEKVAYVTQTTLSQSDIANIISILKRKYPQIKGPARSNICYATQNRQDAVRRLAERADIIFVVGSKNSSNSNRLREVAEQAGGRSYLIDDYSDINPEWLDEVQIIGITAGASAPERLVEGVLDWLKVTWNVEVEEMKGEREIISFKPASLEGDELA
ncbi:MAG: 4-hydroxy-3-methylbut-2-enyl diphosphate reductase [Desulfobulbaceae bacterium]|nr:MAG: 4-hydroxy-3-methylbut-2-enyl diphosphate reductase [Desulfobulbaceae bacterium]